MSSTSVTSVQVKLRPCQALPEEECMRDVLK